MSDTFRFKHFAIENGDAALKLGTDAVLLGAAMTLSPSDSRLLDIGTGTGVIALMAAQRLDGQCSIDAIDIDEPSAKQAALNFSNSQWSRSLNAIWLPLQKYCPRSGFDCIFSNPPYFDGSLRNPDARESASRHTDSLSYHDICAFSAEHLTPDGHLSLILPSEEEKRLIRTAASFNLHLFRIIRIRTTPVKAHKRIIAEFTKHRFSGVAEEEITLQTGNKRSEEYRLLTKDFYL